MRGKSSVHCDESMSASGSIITKAVVKEHRLGVYDFDARTEELENVGCGSENTKDEAKLPVPGILDKSDAQNGSTGEKLLHTDVVPGDPPPRNSAGLRSIGYGFKMGDMVWGKVKSHPWWPGFILEEAFASLSVRRKKKDGYVLVAFFDTSYKWFNPAKLIPFEPHFLEKSQQTASSKFVDAVKESVDEACRRSALGLTCFCMNPYICRPTKVPRHIFVDVLGHDPDGIYSVGQIQKARENFQPKRSLSFIQQLAAAPEEDTMSLSFATEKATALAYRRAAFKKFETYTQLFGEEPVCPVVSPPPSVDESVQARLSSPFVIALSSNKNSTKVAKSREHLKNDGYLFKQGDKPIDMGTSQILQGISSSSASSVCEDRESTKAVGDYIFQRHESLTDRDQEGTTSSKYEEPTSKPSLVEVGYPMPYTDEENARGEDTIMTRESYPPSIKSKKASGVLMLDAEKSNLVEKKKRRTGDSPGSLGYLQKPSVAENASGASGKVELPGKPNPNVPPSVAVSEQFPIVSRPAEKRMSKLQQVLDDLKALAVSSFHERNRRIRAKNLVLRFRSLVYKKSLAAPPHASGDTKASELQSARTASGDAGISPSLRSPKPDDQIKGGKKRARSEHLEDPAVKRPKKVHMISANVTAKKRKASELQGSDGEVKDRPPSRIGVKLEEPKLQKSRIEEPTFLEMRYPPGTSIPSIAELKARFARFGPMDTSQNRVFYITNSCRILFLYKEDAENAYTFGSGNKSTFPNVRFSLKLYRDATVAQPVESVQLKSCLKKPSRDESGSKNSARVRFNMGDGETAVASRRVPVMNSTTKNGSSSSSSSSIVKDVQNDQQNVFPKHSLIPPPLSPQVEVEISPGNLYYATELPPPPSSTDISVQMLNLLTKCSDVVTNVKSVLGYVPYHAL